MNLATLHADLFGEAPHPLAADLGAWLVASRRFAAFVMDARPKVRKKLRNAQTPEGALGLHLELETAYLLLQERALSVLYEPPTPEGRRAPDFAVACGRHTFWLEVTRLQGAPGGGLDGGAVTPERLAEAVCGKLGQLQPGGSNVLLVGVPGPAPPPEGLRAAMLGLQRRAERGDERLFKQARVGDRRAFFGHYGRLSDLLICGLPRNAGSPLTAWTNPQAKHPLLKEARAALYRSQT